MLPPFNEYGVLPEGIHDCTFEEAQARFGDFQGSDRRPRLWADFREFFHEAKAGRFVVALILDRSFVTSKPAPNDIDFILVLPAGWDFEADLPPGHYNLVSKKTSAKPLPV